ncbi:Semaphorin-3B [Chelonia mydas]|uniref:Semaphorin-3B n=1 Tax=Chelonia mydas TaxID=8469 RepID=M7BE70_CHEMY|nr:Semaphorin-3B [Chelonia mydas]
MIQALLLPLWILGGWGRMAGPHPRLRLSFQELKARHGLRTYGLERSCCYEALLLDEERGRLFVGGKNYLASLSLDNISKQDKKIYWPAPVEWREECNWAGKDINELLDPQSESWEELYSGVATDLMGRDFTIFRSLGLRPSIRTEQHDSRWLNEPKFVDVFWIPESENPDDDKIYFFFRETAVEGQQGLGKASFARIGQICRNDLGGRRSLVNKWTTFLKARLVCSVPGSDGGDTFFDELRECSVFRGSAVCLYNMHDIRRAFLGPFAHKEGPNYQWVSYQGRVPYPRPGMCPSKTFGTFSSTKDFPDDGIQFARNHPLMANPVLPHSQRPVFLQTSGDYTFSRIAVDRVTAADGHYDVLFIGTDIGTVLKVVSVPKDSWQNMDELLLEELQVFKDSSPITSMQISSKRQQLYVGSPTSLSQLPLHRCGIYGKGCAECCLARDPYCAWNGTSCTRYMPNTKRRFRRQDVRNGDPNTLCSGDPHRSSVPEKKLYGVEGSSAFLECVPKSLQARVLWTYQKASDTPRKEVQLDERVLQTERGILLRSVARKDTGLYHCQATEHGFTQTLLRLSLEVIGAREEVPAEPASSKLWYQDFLQLVDHPNLSTMDQVCHQLWGRMSHQPKKKLPLPSALSIQAKPHKWKHVEETRKARKRRTHELPRAERGPRSAAAW